MQDGQRRHSSLLQPNQRRKGGGKRDHLLSQPRKSPRPRQKKTGLHKSNYFLPCKTANFTMLYLIETGCNTNLISKKIFDRLHHIYKTKPCLVINMDKWWIAPNSLLQGCADTHQSERREAGGNLSSEPDQRGCYPRPIMTAGWTSLSLW